MTNDDKPQSLTVIIGKQLRVFREDHGLRQEDVAEAARELGLSWGRSSVAALEAGNRDLKLEELILLNALIKKLGGWDRPFLPPHERVLVGGVAVMEAVNVGRQIRRLCSEPSSDRKGEASAVDDDLSLGELENIAPGDLSVRGLQRLARGLLTYRLMLARLYPRDYMSVDPIGGIHSEINRKVAERLVRPDGRAEVTSGIVCVFAFGLWGRSVGDERDHRTSLRGEYDSKRALQSARGHVTRELIAELQSEMDARWPEVREILDEREAAIEAAGEDREALRKWQQEVWKETKPYLGY